jgi:hypothetical protein
MEDIIPLHALETTVNIAGDIALGMPYMQPGSTGIGKHIEYIAFGLIGVEVLFSGTNCAKDLMLKPVGSPLFFNTLVVVLSVHKIYILFFM